MPAPRRPEYDTAVKLYADGLSVADVAACFGVTRQAMYVILKRRNAVFRPQPQVGALNVFFVHGKGYTPKQARARGRVMKAIRSGKLVPQPCERCDFVGRADNGRNLVQAHHDDYDKPLEVRWLCQKCHYKEHHP